jgi:hypothetical protein
VSARWRSKGPGWRNNSTVICRSGSCRRGYSRPCNPRSTVIALPPRRLRATVYPYWQQLLASDDEVANGAVSSGEERLVEVHCLHHMATAFHRPPRSLGVYSNRFNCRSRHRSFRMKPSCFGCFIRPNTAGGGWDGLMGLAAP